MTISKSKALYDELVLNYPDAMQPISDLSKNTAGNKEFINSNYCALNFDRIKNVCADNPAKEKSPDALFFHEDKLYFVEFKEGGAAKDDIRMKIHEAILTLYHFAVSKKIASREEFLALDIRYAVIMRSQTRGRPSISILDTLESRSTHFNLKNMEGLLVRKTEVAFLPKTISKLLHKITEGKVGPVQMIDSDQNSFVELVAP